MESTRHVPPLDRFSVVMGPDELRELSSSDGRIAEHVGYYIHYEERYRCVCVVVEVESSKVSKALRQLESTVRMLRRRGRELTGS